MAAVRSLFRWNNWLVNLPSFLIDWDAVCVWVIEEEQIYYLVEECGMSGEVNMHVTTSPDDRKMRGFDWSAWLGTAEITSYTFDLPEGLTKIASVLDDSTKTLIMWTGGVPGTWYKVTGWVEANDGRKDHGIFTVFVKP